MGASESPATKTKCLYNGSGRRCEERWKVLRNEEQAKVQSEFQSQTPKKVQEEQEITVCAWQHACSMH